VYQEYSEPFTPPGYTIAVEGIINMGENGFLKSMGVEDDPLIYTFHFFHLGSFYNIPDIVHLSYQLYCFHHSHQLQYYILFHF
jgi:hypothetical protein